MIGFQESQKLKLRTQEGQKAKQKHLWSKYEAN